MDSWADLMLANRLVLVARVAHVCPAIFDLIGSASSFLVDSLDMNIQCSPDVGDGLVTKLACCLGFVLVT